MEPSETTDQQVPPEHSEHHEGCDDPEHHHHEHHADEEIMSFPGIGGRRFPPVSMQGNTPHRFWGKQPVPGGLSNYVFTVTYTQQIEEQGPIDDPKTTDEIRQEPLKLPGQFEWVSIDVTNDEWMDKLYELLAENYVEDDDNMFRFDYSIPFLRWALMPPGYLMEWHVGIVVKATQKLVGFISAIPARVNVYGVTTPMVEINFLCVYRTLRTKRLAPVLIKEITRRVNVTNIWQAVYTAGVVLPTPIAQARYYHRSLNPLKLVDVGFSRLSPKMTRALVKRLYRVPNQPQIPGIRPMQDRDVSAVYGLLTSYLNRFQIYVEFTEEEVAHFLLPRDNVIYSYVVQDPTSHKITDFCSFYYLPSSILKHPKHKKLNAAYCYYLVPDRHTIHELFTDMLILANQQEFDVFNALDIMDNQPVFKDLKFGIGDGNLHYYLYNWRCKRMNPGEVGIVLVQNILGKLQQELFNIVGNAVQVFPPLFQECPLITNLMSKHLWIQRNQLAPKRWSWASVSGFIQNVPARILRLIDTLLPAKNRRLYMLLRELIFPKKG